MGRERSVQMFLLTPKACACSDTRRSGSGIARVGCRVMWDVTTSRLVTSDTLEQRVVFETSVTIYQSTLHNVSEDLNLLKT
jgi:hypothetical protein